MLRRLALLSLLALVVAVTAAACGGGDEEEPAAPAAPPSETAAPPAAPSGSLQGVVWQWQGSQYGDGSSAVPDDPSHYTIQFADDDTALIQADCNSVHATYEANEGSISITPGPSTKVACPEDSLDSEYLRDLEGAAIYFFDDAGDLLMDIKFDSGTMRFSAAS